MASNEKADKQPGKRKRFRRVRQIADAYRMTRKVDRWVGWVILGFFLAGWGLTVAIGLLVGQGPYFAIIGVPIGLIAGLIVFGRRAERSAYAQVEGQPGAAAAIVENARGWTVTPAVAANRYQDVVSRAVGRPGIVLIGEGDPARLGPLMTSEKKKMSRYVPDVPIHELSVGLFPEQVPLRKLQRSLNKLPKALAPRQVTEIRQRLNALGGAMQSMPIPKGPMPKGGRVPRGKIR
jgi:F0F1-type ATP synthase assembly protein I